MEIDAVTSILREAADIAIMPRFRALAGGEVTRKPGGDVVTVADRDAEDYITPRLRALVDAPVVGEEAVASNPDLLAAVRDAPVAWVVDPLDGTANFVAGRPEFAVMAALVRERQTVASWILRPTEDSVYVAERGSGAWRDGVRVHRKAASHRTAELRGIAHTRYLDAGLRGRVQAAAALFGELGRGTSCAGVDYAQLADGTVDFVLTWRTLPWDHAPGTLILTEAGGVTRRPDGTGYRPGDGLTGLINAADDRCWRVARALLLPAVVPGEVAGVK
jgi:fructose-1,6-bisphosphatase/inositol monophosphatase family enzyme